MNSSAGGHVRANGIRQHYLHFPGPGPTVLIVPGIISPAILWHQVGEWLSATYDCFVLDVRGRGLSEAGAHLDYGFDACARDVLGFAEAMDFGLMIVIGHSMGARIALRAARQAPTAFDSLVLLDPPTSGPGRRPYPVPKARTLGLLRAAQRGEALAAIKASTARPWPDDLQRLRAEWLATCDERAVHAAYDDFHDQDMFVDFAQTRASLALLAAGEGGVVSDRDFEEMREMRPELLAIRLQGVGHQMQAEDFSMFTQALGEILRDVHSNKRSRS